MTQFWGEKRHAVWSEKLKIKKGNFSRRFERNLEKLKDDFFTPFWAKFWKLRREIFHAVLSEILKKERTIFLRRLKRKQVRRFERKTHAVIAKFASFDSILRLLLLCLILHKQYLMMELTSRKLLVRIRIYLKP